MASSVLVPSPPPSKFRTPIGACWCRGVWFPGLLAPKTAVSLTPISFAAARSTGAIAT